MNIPKYRIINITYPDLQELVSALTNNAIAITPKNNLPLINLSPAKTKLHEFYEALNTALESSTETVHSIITVIDAQTMEFSSRLIMRRKDI